MEEREFEELSPLQIDYSITEAQVLKIAESLNRNVKNIEFKGMKIHGEPSQTTTLMADYAKFFAEVTNPKNTKINPFLKNKYAPLDVVLNVLRPVLGKYGLSVMQIPTIDGEFVKVDTLLMHKDGAFMSIEGLCVKPPKMSAQEIGSVITYLRRYTISAIVGIASEEEDDDGNQSSGKKSVSEPEDISKMTFATIKAKTTALGKDKMGVVGESAVSEKIEETLGKGMKIAKTTEEHKDKLVELYNKLLEM